MLDKYVQIADTSENEIRMYTMSSIVIGYFAIKLLLSSARCG